MHQSRRGVELNRREIPVAIVGAGPVGLSLALGLARQGVRSVLLEKKAGISRYSKAPGIHIRTREIFRLWGVEERFLAEGILAGSITQYNVEPGRRPFASLNFRELEPQADRPGILILEQGETERLLLEAVRESGMCDVRFEAEAVDLAQGRDGARLTFREAGGERMLDAEFIVGCDGASSFVRNALGLPFDGMTYSLRPMLADVRLTDERDGLLWPRLRNSRGQLSVALRLSPGLWRLIKLDRGDPAKGEEVPEEEVRALAADLLGDGPVEVVWASRFRIHLRSSPRFRVGRILLAGDAAHVHSPVGGQGMNGGIQDANNLAWKLAYAIEGADVNPLLDSYETERRAVVVESVSRYTDWVTRLFLLAPSFVREAAFLLFRAAVCIGPIRRRLLERTTMLDLHYPASPILDKRERSAGVRLPNPLLQSPEGRAVRLYNLLPNRAVLLDLAERRAFSEHLPLRDVIRIGPGAHHDGSGLLRRLLGGRDGWILVRPDSHVAWGRNYREGMADAVGWALGLRD